MAHARTDRMILLETTLKCGMGKTPARKPGCIQAGKATRHRALPSDCRISPSREIWFGLSNPASGGVGSRELRRRSVPRLETRVLAVSSHCEGIGERDSHPARDLARSRVSRCDSVRAIRRLAESSLQNDIGTDPAFRSSQQERIARGGYPPAAVGYLLPATRFPLPATGYRA